MREKLVNKILSGWINSGDVQKIQELMIATFWEHTQDFNYNFFVYRENWIDFVVVIV